MDYRFRRHAARNFSQPLAPFLGSGSPLHPPGVSRPGGSPAAGSSGHAMVWSWYGWPLEFKRRAPHGKVTAGLERVTAGHGGARHGGVTAVTVLGGASPPWRWSRTHSFRCICGSGVRQVDLRLSVPAPERSTPVQVSTTSHVGPRRLRGGAGSLPAGGTPTDPVDNRWGVRVAARGAGCGEGRGGRDQWRYAARVGGTRRRLRRGGPRGVKGAKAAGDTWWRGRAATDGAATALGAAGWEPRGGEASPRSAGAPHRRLAGID